jgi:hypothetical protein
MAEALAAALYICTMQRRVFKYATSGVDDPLLDRRGHSFLSANEELLDRYAACQSGAEVIQVQNQFLEQMQSAPRRNPAAGGTFLLQCFDGQPYLPVFGFGIPRTIRLVVYSGG